MNQKKINLGHGSGGRLMHRLIRELLLKKLANPVLGELQDSARLPGARGICSTTDSFVVSPLFFPGGDIGKLAVYGTVNDLAVSGALPEYLSLAMIIEEGLDIKLLEKIVDSIANAARRARVQVVTGDLKVVPRGSCDKIFINTSGVGRFVGRGSFSLKMVRPRDRIIVTGNIARHGLAVLAARKGLELGINSDCAPLSGLLMPLLKKGGCGVKFMRDPTRGGLATTLNEIAEGCGYGMLINESGLPVSARTAAACELLGIDPLYVANEGAAVMIVEEDAVKNILQLLHRNPLGKRAREIGVISAETQKLVVLRTVNGSERIIDMLTADPLPRIC